MMSVNSRNVAAALAKRSFAVLTLVLLAGCMGGSSGSKIEPSSSGPSTMRMAIFGNPTNIPPEQKGVDNRTLNCPGVDIIEGASAYRMGRTGGGSDIGHQASLIDVARECAFDANTMTLKVGVQGRMLLGAQGKAGSYVVPVRVVVKREDKIVASRFAKVSVTIPAGDSSVGFTHIEQNISLPITDRDPSDEYDVYVGFDANGGTADPRSGKRKRR